MSENTRIAKDRRHAKKRSELDIDVLVELVWLDLEGSVPRSDVEATVSQLICRYENAKVKQYLPILVQRQAKQLLRKRAI